MTSTVLFVGGVIEDDDHIVYRVDADKSETAETPARRAKPSPSPSEGEALEVRLRPLANLISTLPLPDLKAFAKAGLTGDVAHARTLLAKAHDPAVHAQAPLDAALAALRACALEADTVVTVGSSLVTMQSLEPGLANEMVDVLCTRTLYTILAQNLLAAYINVVTGAVLSTSVFHAMLKPPASQSKAAVPQSQLEARVTFFLAKDVKHGSQGAKFAKHTQAALHFLDEEGWQIPARLVFYYVNEEPLKLPQLFSGWRDMDAGVAQAWARHALHHVKPAALQAGLKQQDGLSFAVADSRTRVFVLASWDTTLHAKAKEVLAGMPSQTMLGQEWSEAVVPPVPSAPVGLERAQTVSSFRVRSPPVPKPALKPAEAARLARLCSVLRDWRDRNFVETTGQLDSRSYVGQARTLLFERLREVPDDGQDAATRLCDIGVAEGPVTKPLFDMVRLLDEVGMWGGRSLAHCLWSFLLALWRPSVLLTPLGDSDDRTPMEVGSCVEVHGEAASGRYVKVFAETSESLGRKTDGNFIEDGIDALLPPKPDGCLRLYHATSLNSVTNIVRCGINLNMCLDTSDFGKGFYMTPNIDCAVHFLVTEAPPENHHHPRALLVVDVDQTGVDAMPELPELRDGGAIWESVVSTMRGQLADNAVEPLSDQLAERLDAASVLVGPLTTRQEGRRHLGPMNDTAVSWEQRAFVKRRSCRLVDPSRYLAGIEDTLVRALHVVRLLPA
ncbi:hypothetical protein PTSG_00015 [Salpingoeca rosetta]|uniref:Uncharacterized protein n=1 Tax=Salpingoeca rosetta (strain ATCC 50818 / BSB-021) TaxID=946362 RepID=F2TVA3_SALR5|nr:uncharacterized protein PTSG_00015 [Salpingoeca rosetta]EGD71999.1 hypothetical protein PTSG_00015 [Salpingoeca rosetta]|eukprot:XP_004998571.1 hypothetical protein PTSG_00015 [Salpingoeca rosetta]